MYNINLHNTEKLKKLHIDVLMGKEDYIPLIVNPPCPGRPRKSEYWENVKNAVKKDQKALQPKLAVGSDWIPTVNVSVYQNILIPALYNAEIVFPDGDSDPICRPCFSNLDQALDAGLPSLEHEIIHQMLKDLSSTQEILNEPYNLSFVVVSSPFDLAFLMVGAAFIMTMIEDPTKAHLFIENLTHLSIEVVNLVNKKLNKSGDASVKSRGIYCPGFRLACDSIVNLSPQLLRDFVLPVISNFSKRLGPMYIHFCTEPASATHVLPVLLESDNVIAVDNWQGPEIFIGEESAVKLQKKIAIIGDLDLDNQEDLGNFFDLKAVQQVPRKGGRGLFMTANTRSITEGKKVYLEWQKYF